MAEEPDRGQGDPVLVVLDVNILLDVAELLGPPFSWQRFDEEVTARSSAVIPHPNYRVNSLMLIAACRSGIYARGRPLEVWTSDHIEELVWIKASQPKSQEVDEDTGFGWTEADAQDLVDVFVGDLVAGNSVGEVQVAYGSPPLSHEDGKVFETARVAGREGVFYERFCITRDKKMRKDDLPGETDVLYPHELLNRIRRDRRVGPLARVQAAGSTRS